MCVRAEKIHEELIVHLMRICVIFIKSDIKNIPLSELKGLWVCHTLFLMFFMPSGTQIIIIRLYYLLIKGKHSLPSCLQGSRCSIFTSCEVQGKWGCRKNLVLYYIAFQNYSIIYWENHEKLRHLTLEFKCTDPQTVFTFIIECSISSDAAA